MFRAERVVVATGYNRVPIKPELPGQRDFRGVIWHSHEYRNGAPFQNENVLIVGMGNTGAEVALDLLENGARPFISVRGPVNIVGRETFGRPTQPTAILLSRLPDWVCDVLGRLYQRISVGDVSAYGLGKPAHSPTYDTRRGKTPVIDIGTLDQIKKGNIAVLPGIKHIRAKSVLFTDGRELPFDAMILATGYRPSLTSVLGDALAATVLNESGYPKNLWFDKPDLKGLYFVGFAVPVTGVLYNLNIDSKRIAKHIAENNFVTA